MKLSVTLIAASIIASAAAAATPIVGPSSTDHELVFREENEAVRKSCADNDTECKKLEQSKKFYLEMYRKTLREVEQITKDLDEACGWNWFDKNLFETKEPEWSEQLTDLEQNYRGRLPGIFNVDQQIKDLRQRFDAIHLAVKVRKAVETDKRSDAEDIALVFELSPMINSFYFLNHDQLRPNSEIKSRVEHIDSMFKKIKENVSRNTEMDQKSRSFFNSQAQKVEQQLNQLKQKAEVTL